MCDAVLRVFQGVHCFDSCRITLALEIQGLTIIFFLRRKAHASLQIAQLGEAFLGFINDKFDSGCSLKVFHRCQLKLDLIQPI